MYELRGGTNHFEIYCEDGDESGQLLADAILGNCEYNFNAIASAFPLSLPPGLPFQIYVRPQDYVPHSEDAKTVGIARHERQAATEIECLPPPGFDAQDGAQVAGAEASIAALVVDVFGATVLTWGDGTSTGLGLDLAISYSLYPDLSGWESSENTWLNAQSDWTESEPLADFVNSSEKDNPAAAACAFLFLTILNEEGYGWNRIVMAGLGGDSTLADVYRE